ncbi:MAG: penicillin-binding transpeptidase domain-containing protein [Terriglobales bacterium]
MRIPALLLTLAMFSLSISSGRTQTPGGIRADSLEEDFAGESGPSLFAQSASQTLNRDFPGADISFLLLDAKTGVVLASRWDHPETPIPMGSLVKPFVALAYGELHEFKYPTHICRGTATGCWRPRGHGPVDLTSAIAYSCNSYFRLLTTNMTAAEVSPTADRFGLQPPAPEIAGAALAGLGAHAESASAGTGNHDSDNQWLITPMNMAGAYLELIRSRDQPGVRLLLTGMELAARQGTGAEVGRALPHSRALVKTGTAPCTHTRHAPGDGFTVALLPADAPKILLLVRVHGVPGAQAARTAGQMLRRIDPTAEAGH